MESQWQYFPFLQVFTENTIILWYEATYLYYKLGTCDQRYMFHQTQILIFTAILCNSKYEHFTEAALFKRMTVNGETRTERVQQLSEMRKVKRID